jgi:predicted RNA-binding protein (virulence factor B family)
MIELYHSYQLTVCEIREHSVYVDGGEHGYIPLRDRHDDLQIGDQVDAYVYLDASDEVVATLATAKVQIGECAYLKIVSSDNKGTFLDWGLPKDLLLPLSEQTGTIREGRFCFVYVFQDEQGRPTASMKLHYYLDEDQGDLEVGDAVDIIIASESDLGFKAVINNEQLGLIYHDELARPLEIGAKIKGWVKQIRDDGKINININRLDSETRDQLEDTILTHLKDNNGRLELSDKSAPDLIYDVFKVSKKNFKRALSSLYKQRLINISPDFIELVESTDVNEKQMTNKAKPLK